MALTQFVRGLNVGEKCGNHHLHRLTVQRETPFGRFLQGISTRPWQMSDTRCFVRLHASIPDLRGLHLSSLAALELPGRQVLQLLDFHRFQATIVA